MPDRSGPVVRSAQDIRALPAKFGDPHNPGRGSHFALIRGSDGYIAAAGNAKVAIFSRWIIRHSGNGPDGKPQHRFRAQFKWTNEVLMNMVGNGKLRPRVILQMMTSKGRENVDILGWDEWKLEGGVLTLENIYQTEGVKYRPLDGQ
jgi:hypothetical protein